MLNEIDMDLLNKGADLISKTNRQENRIYFTPTIVDPIATAKAKEILYQRAGGGGLGALLGGLGGGAYSYLRDDSNALRDILIGALLGGGAGALAAPSAINEITTKTTGGDIHWPKKRPGR